MDSILHVNVTEQMDGYNVYLTPLLRHDIERVFDRKLMVTSVNLAKFGDGSFEALEERVRKFIIPLLTGFSIEDLKSFNIVFEKF